MSFYHNRYKLLTLTWWILLIGGCSTTPPSGVYYKDDRPPKSLPIDPKSVADALPRHAPLSASGNRPYTVFGKRYHPMAKADGYVQRGTASWYATKYHGKRTSSGERYDMYAMTAAHPLLPLPSWVRVTNLDNARSVVVKVNDRGPFLHNRIIDLSYIAAYKLGIVTPGVGRVEVRALTAKSPSARKRNGGISIQVGAYTIHDNAKSMKQRLQNAGYSEVALVEKFDSKQRRIYRVLVGPFGRSEAYRIQKNLESLLAQPIILVTN